MRRKYYVACLATVVAAGGVVAWRLWPAGDGPDAPAIISPGPDTEEATPNSASWLAARAGRAGPVPLEGVIAGVVVDDTGLGASSVRVSLIPQIELVSPRSVRTGIEVRTTGGLGDFEFNVADDRAAFRIEVDGDSTHERATRLDVHAGDRLKIVRFSGAVLDVSVTRAGSPVSDLVVIAKQDGVGNAMRPFFGVTNREGRVQFTGLPAGSPITVTSPGGAFDPLVVQMPRSGVVSKTIDAKPAMVVRIAVHDRETMAPIPGAEVRVGDDPNSEIGSFSTGSDGEVQLCVFGPVTEILIEARGYCGRKLGVRDVPSTRVLLERGVSVVGSVVGAQNLPARGAEVTLMPSSPVPGRGSSRPGLPLTQICQADARGQFRFDAVEGQLAYYVRAVDSATGFRASVRLSVGSDAVDLGRLVLTPGAGLRVELVSSDGMPAEGRIVEISSVGDGGDDAQDEFLSLLSRRLLVTDASGFCSVRGLEAGSCSVMVIDRGCISRVFLQVQSDATVVQRIVLPRFVEFHVRVVDGSGTPQEGIRVLAAGRGGASALGVSDQFGLARLCRPAESVRVMAAEQLVGGRRVTSKIIDVTAGSEPPTLHVDFKPVRRGVVLDSQGEPVGGALISVIQSSGQVDEIAAEMDGGFEVVPPDAGSHIVFLGRCRSTWGIRETKLAAWLPIEGEGSGILTLRSWDVGAPRRVKISVRRQGGDVVAGRAVRISPAGDLTASKLAATRTGLTDALGELWLDAVSDVPLLIVVGGADPQGASNRYVRRPADDVALIVPD